MHITVDNDSVRLCRQLCAHRADVVLAVVVHDVVGCNEGRHIATRLPWQIGVDFPVVALASGTVDGAVDVFWSAVVCGNHEIPIPENLIQVAQIMGCCIRGLDRIASFIDQGVYLQAITLARGQHELPEASGTHTRDGIGIQSGFNHWQVAQFERHVIGFKGLFEDGHIEVAGTKPVAHSAAHTRSIAVDKFTDHLIVGHLHDVGHPSETIDISGIREFRILISVVAVSIRGEVHL